MAGVIGIDFMHGTEVGAFFQMQPGFYTQSDIGISSFDVPITLGRIFVVREKKFYVFGGAYASFLRGGSPVLPLAGIIWIPSDNVRLLGLLPTPRLIYSATKKIDLWVGGELVGGAFRTDRNDNIQPTKLNGTTVNFRGEGKQATDRENKERFYPRGEENGADKNTHRELEKAQ